MVIVVPTIKPVLKISDRVVAAICMRSLLGPDTRADRLHLVWKEKEKENDDSASKHARAPSLNHHRIPANTGNIFVAVCRGRSMREEELSEDEFERRGATLWQERGRFARLFSSFSLFLCRTCVGSAAFHPPSLRLNFFASSQNVSR